MITFAFQKDVCGRLKLVGVQMGGREMAVGPLKFSRV